ncbi:alpha/beta-hydrolase [Podospora aff. communis PSN243]|uniref:Alpha/beta-hydrolase n=1 Tax=Podospora aff. communis PSN243 TaxID=3040156 RepID=A0AAV9GG06_9PEZI|nr:alpha/beta-hydrolase [Podospora aff. communis PSN243]
MSSPTTTIPILTTAPTTPHTHTIIFLHGRGDTAQNFSTSLLTRSLTSQNQTLPSALPSIRWVFPQAPSRPVASDPGRTVWPQWFDVWDVRDFSHREELQAEGLREVVPQLKRLIADEAALLGGRWDRIVLAGISMGAATGVHVLFNLDVPDEAGGRLAAFLGFSCRCPFAGRDLAGMRAVLGLGGGDGDGVVRGTPVLLEHCADDPLVLVEQGRTLRETLRGFGARVEWREYPRGGHWFHSPEGMDDAVEFLRRNVVGGGGAAGDVLGTTAVMSGDDDAMELE